MLAFACAFTMFAGAAFTDSADIKATEAVDMLTALGVIDGYDDGSFKPEATITRAEAAKMIYTIRNGGNDNASAFEGSSVFTDVYKGHWAAGYINFCYANGIVDGKAKNAFKPDDKVTGTELAKMLLICMGYQADKSGLTGAAWSQKTNGLASQNGLYDDVTASVSAAMPRQYAAQIMFNALEADTVQWSSDVNGYEKVKTTGLEWKPNPNNKNDGSWVNVEKNETLGKKWMKLDTLEGSIITKVEKEDGKDTFKVTTASGETYTKLATDCSNLIGQKVKIMIKDNKTDQVYGIYADDDSKVIASGIVGDLEKVSSDDKKVKLAGTEYKLDSKTDEMGIYKFNGDTKAVKLMSGYTANKKDALAANVAANTIKMIDNDGNGKIDNIIETPREVYEVTYVGTSNFSLQGKGTIKFDDCASVYKGIAKDDYAIYVDGKYTVSGDHEVAKAEVISAEVNGTKGNAKGDYQVRIDGKWYYLTADMDQLESGTSYDFTVVDGVVFNADETEASSKDVLAIVDVDESLNGSFSASASTQDVKAVFMDGSEKTITVEKLNKNNDGKDAADVNGSNKLQGATVSTTGDITAYGDIGKLFTYTVKSNGNYELTLLGSKNAAGYKNFGNANEIASNNRINNKPIDDDAVVFVIYGNDLDVKVISGKTVNDWDKAYNGTVQYATKEVNGIDYVKVAAITAAKKYTGMGSDYQYGYLTATPYTSSKNPDGSTDKCTAFEIWNGTEAVTVYTDGVYSGKALHTGDVLIYTNDGKYISVENFESDLSVKVKKAAVYGFDYKAEGNIVFTATGKTADAATYKLDEDCVFLAVNDDDNVGVGNDMNQLIKAQPDKSGDYVKNAVVIYNDDTDHKVVAVIFDVENNEWLSK